MAKPRLKSVPAQQIIPDGLTAYHLQDVNVRPLKYSSITYTVFSIAGATVTGLEDANDNPVQWTYNLTEVVKVSPGYGIGEANGWFKKPGGFSAFEASGPIYGVGYNSMENYNTGVGRQGTGIDHDGDNYPTTYQMQPLQTNSIWPGIIVAFDQYWDKRLYPDQSELLYEGWVFGVNAEDGTCS